MRNENTMKENIHTKVIVYIEGYNDTFTAYSRSDRLKPFFTYEEGLKIVDFINKIDEHQHGEWNPRKEIFTFNDHSWGMEEYASEMVLTDEGVKTLYPIGSVISVWLWREVKAGVG